MEQRLSWLFVFFIVQCATAAIFTPGNLLVTRSGTNTAVFQTNSNALFVDELMLNGTLVQTIPLNCIVANNINAANIQTSPDEKYASTACYPGAAGASLGSISDRVIPTLLTDGTVTTTTITSSLSLRLPYCGLAYSGYAAIGASSGMLSSREFGTTGAAATGTTSQVSVGTTPIYNIQIVDGTMYVSSFGVTSPFIIASVDGKIPTAAGTTVTSLFTPSAVVPSIPSSYGTFVWNATEIYGTSSSFIWKATYNGASWTSITLNIATPANGITVRDINRVRTVFFTLESALYKTTEVNGTFTTAVLLRSVNSGKARYHDITTVPNACVDGTQNLAETDVDCGGGVCGKCGTDKACMKDSDCSSTYCNLFNNTCQIPTCRDNVKNQDETGTDCGGANCPSCSSGGGCSSNADCNSNICTAGVCIATCSDNEQNQGESDVDCGGETLCDRCSAGSSCSVDGDCISDDCFEGTCQPTCYDGVQNQDETDTDCGGSCDPCEEGYNCEGYGDCYGDCFEGVCIATCDDGRTNQGESDTDCGGDTSCDRCPANSDCNINSDCAGNQCSINGTCVPNCQDGQTNNGESDTDCGGSGNTCNRCTPGDSCDFGSDCDSGVCSSGECQEPSCYDGVSNGDESGIDCGGSCGTCGSGGGCNSNSDCVSGVCEFGFCQPTCSDGVMNQDETDTDCGGHSCETRCNSGKTCLVGSDCRSGYCDTLVNGDHRCRATCDDGEINQGETDTDCGGDSNGCPRCREYKYCTADADCISYLCSSSLVSPMDFNKRGLARVYTCVPTCSDGILNNNETDTDCGGANCLDCIGKPCSGDLDCPGSYCNEATSLCKFNCQDELVNNGETDVDCGGPNCNACDAGLTCSQNSDCVSNLCSELICQPTCDDGQKNGNETGIDCGAVSGCGLCSSGQGCTSADDCKSDECSGGFCAPTCDDGELNQGESDIDCGSVCGGNCAINKDCLADADCASRKCSATGLCVVSCTDGVKNQNETDVDCGGSCSPCALGSKCLINADCANGLECNSVSKQCVPPAPPVTPPVPEPVAPPVEPPMEPPVPEPVAPPVDPPVIPGKVSSASVLMVSTFVMFIVFLLA